MESTDQNKAVVRRFMTELLEGGNFDLADELLAPNYVNRAFDTDLAGFKAAIAGLAAAVPERRFEIEDLVAEGNAVVVRFSADMTDRSGKKISYRGLTFLRLADGRIVEDDPISRPDLMQELAYLMPTGASSSGH